MIKTQGNKLALGVAKGAALLVAAQWGIRLIGFISILVVARVLSPGDFGLAAVAMSYLFFIEEFSSANMESALVRLPEREGESYDTVWTLAAFRGIVVCAIVACSAPLVASLMADERLVPLILALSVRAVIDGVRSPRLAHFDKDLEFSKVVSITLTGKTISAIVTILIALAYESYWALILGILAGAIGRTFFGYWLKPYKPKVSFAKWRAIVGFTGWLTAGGVVNGVTHRLDSMLLGSILGIPSAGLFFMGGRLTNFVANELVNPLRRSLYPGFTRIAHYADSLKHRTIEVSTALAALTLPLAVGLAFVASEFVLLALGKSWLPIVPMVQWTSPAMGLYALSAIASSVAMACGRQRTLFFRRDLIFMAFRVAALVLGAELYGFLGAIIAVAVASLLHTLLNLLVIGNIISIAPYIILLKLWRVFVSCGIMALALFAFDTQLSHLDISLVILLMAKILLGAMVYLTIYVALWMGAGRPSGFETRLVSFVQERFVKKATTLVRPQD